MAHNAIENKVDVIKYDGTTREKLPTDVVEANAADASTGLTLLSAAGTGAKNRVFKIILTCDAADSIALSDGFGTYYASAGNPIVLDYGPEGKLQSSDNTAVTATTSGTNAVGALVLYSTE